MRVLDVGLYGLQIETAAELVVGRRYCLEVRHGKWVACVEVAVCWASVSRMERSRGAMVPMTRAGVQFTDIVCDEEAGIWSWMLVPAAASC